MSEATNQKADFWAVIDLFGHQRIAGYVTEAPMGGCQFVRVDVPAAGEKPAYTKLLGQGAIYSVTIVSEEIARAVAASIRSEPVSVYDIGNLLQPRLPSDTDGAPYPDEVF